MQKRALHRPEAGAVDLRLTPAARSIVPRGIILDMKLRRKQNDLGVIALIVACTLYLLWRTRSFAPSLLPGYPGDAFFPRIVLIFILICAAVIILQALKGSRGKLPAKAPREDIEIDVRGLTVALAFVVGYLVVFSMIGFEIATFLFLLGLLRVRVKATGMRAWIIASVVSALAVLVLYFCFVLLLGVEMPLLFLPEYVNF